MANIQQTIGYFKYSHGEDQLQRLGRFTKAGDDYSVERFMLEELPVGQHLPIEERHLAYLNSVTIDITARNLEIVPGTVFKIPIFVVNKTHFKMAGGTKIIYREG